MRVLLKTRCVIHLFGAELRRQRPMSGCELNNAVDAQTFASCTTGLDDWVARHETAQRPLCPAESDGSSKFAGLSMTSFSSCLGEEELALAAFNV